MAGSVGFEPTLFDLTSRRFTQLSYDPEKGAKPEGPTPYAPTLKPEGPTQPARSFPDRST